MDQKKPENDLVTDGLPLVRLRRQFDSMNLNAGVQNWIEKTLQQRRPLSPVSGPDLASRRSGATTKVTTRSQTVDPAPTATEETRDKPAMATEAEQAELRLRRLVAADESWDVMAEHAWQVYDAWPKPEIAAKLCELAFLNGDCNDLLDVLNRLKLKQRSFFFLIDPELRSYMVLKLWTERKEKILNQFLHLKNFRTFLLPIEHLFVFWSLYNGGQATKTFAYYKRFEVEINKGFAANGQQLKLSPSRFYFLVGKLAFEQKDESFAKKLLEKIRPNEAEFRKALDLLIQFQVCRDDNGLCVFSRQLLHEKDWHNRVTLLKGFLLDCRNRRGSNHAERLALNDLLKNPFRWFPRSAEAWRSLAGLLVEFVDLDYLLPNVFAVFQDKRFEFEAPSMDRSLWEPLLKIESETVSKQLYWRAMATLHQYVAAGASEESILWRSRELFAQAISKGMTPNKDSWADVHGQLINFLAKTSRFDEKQRPLILIKSKVAGSYLEVSASMVHDYLKLVDQPDPQILKHLEDLVRQREDWSLEVTLIQKIATATHYTNHQLARLWQLFRQLKNSDAAWRVATLAHSRRILNPEVERAWALTGERRLEQSLRPVFANVLEKLLTDYTADQQKLLRALLAVGPLIPELLSFLGRQMKSMKRPVAETQLERDCERLLDKLDWLPASKKVFSSHPDRLLRYVPPFAVMLPENCWSMLFTLLAERLGVSSWRWQLSFLYSEMESLFIHLNRRSETPLPSKVGKWLRSLSPIQRKSWYELGILAKRFNDEQGHYLLGTLMIRLVTSMTANHVQALASLNQMSVPLAMRWNLEQWVLSPAYQEVRSVLRSHISMDVPERLPDQLLNI